MALFLRKWRVIWVILSRNRSFWERCFSGQAEWDMRIAEWQNFSSRMWFSPRRVGTCIEKGVLVFAALENNSNALCHPRGDRSLLVGFYWESGVFGRQDGDALGNGCAIDYFYDSGIGLFQLVSCELDLGGVDLDEGVSGCFLKIICVLGGIHLEMSVLDILLSVLRRREPGTKVAFSSRPVLESCSVMQMYNLSNFL